MCSEGPNEHVGAAFSFILEEKMTLGLAAPPRERVPVFWSAWWNCGPRSPFFEQN
jgi:hypothetical protein